MEPPEPLREAETSTVVNALPWAFALGVVLLLAVGPIVETDLGFHLATGRYILANGSIPATNVLSFAEPNATSVNDEWLVAVLDELAYRIHPVAIVVLRVSLLVTTFAALYASARAWGARPWPAAVVVVLGASASAFRFLDRPFLFSNLTTALTLLGLAWTTHSDSRRKGLGLIAVASFAGPQLHAGALFGLVIVMVSCVASFVPARLAGSLRLASTADEAWQSRLAPLGAALLGWCGAALALCVYHPLPWGVLSLPFVLGSDPYLHANVVEYRVAWDQPLALLLPFWVFVLSSAVALALALRARQSMPVPLVAMALFGLALALRHGRLVDLAVVFASPLLARSVSLETASISLRITQALACIALVSRVAIVPPSSPTLSSDTWPLALHAFMQREHIVGPAFVQDGWAGPYLGLHYPEERVFFHPAFESYSRVFFRQAYMQTRDGEEGWDAMLDQHGVELVMMKFTSPRERARQQGRPNLRARLAESPAWTLVAFDDVGEIYVRREGVNREPAARIGILGVDPDRLALSRNHAVAHRSLSGFATRRLPSQRLNHLLTASRQAE